MVCLSLVVANSAAVCAIIPLSMHDPASALCAVNCPVLADACTCLLEQLSAVCRRFAQAAQRLLARMQCVELDCDSLHYPSLSSRLMLAWAPAIECFLLVGPSMRISEVPAFVAAAVNLRETEVTLWEADDADLADSILCGNNSLTRLWCGGLYVPNKLPHQLLHLSVNFDTLQQFGRTIEVPGLVERLLTALPTAPALQSLVLGLGMNYMSPAFAQAQLPRLHELTIYLNVRDHEPLRLAWLGQAYDMLHVHIRFTVADSSFIVDTHEQAVRELQRLRISTLTLILERNLPAEVQQIWGMLSAYDEAMSGRPGWARVDCALPLCKHSTLRLKCE